MRKRFSYREIHLLSLSTFLAFSPDKQKTCLIDIIHETEQLWHDQEKRKEIADFLGSCLLETTQLPVLISKTRRTQIAKSVASGDLRSFISLIVPLERALGRNESDLATLIEHRDKDESAQVNWIRNPLYVVADNLRSALNIGSIFRTAECLQLSHIYLCGYSVTPENAKLGRSALGSQDLVPWSWHANSMTAITELSAKGLPVYAMETAGNAESLYKFNFPRACGLVLGNERYGLSHETLALCTGTIKIPTFGCKNSLNVANAFSIAASEILRQQGVFKA